MLPDGTITRIDKSGIKTVNKADGTIIKEYSDEQ
jgi:hypothetical protein